MLSGGTCGVRPPAHRLVEPRLHEAEGGRDQVPGAVVVGVRAGHRVVTPVVDAEDELAGVGADLGVSVDPERDTPKQLKSYVKSEVFPKGLIGLTGTPGQIAEAAKRYGVSYAKRQEKGSSDYLMDHVSAAILFGPAGEPIALVPQDGTPEAVAAELGKWVK